MEIKIEVHKIQQTITNTEEVPFTCTLFAKGNRKEIDDCYDLLINAFNLKTITNEFNYEH